MLSREAFDKAIRTVSDPATKIATFGALLSKASGLGARLTIVGGSAITVYAGSRFVSEDVDVVGEKMRIVPVLRTWEFKSQTDADGRVYWGRDDLGLFVDIVHRRMSSGSQRSGRARTFVTAEGPVRVSAVENLIVRRLAFWSREGKPGLIDQAIVLYAENKDDLDMEYLEAEIRREGVGAAYRELRKSLGLSVS
jgi:hypothetical protein